MKVKKEIILLTASLVFSLIVMELVLRAFTIFPIHGARNKISHPVLQYTVDPLLPDVDASGFRNPRAGGSHEIVTLGDSHTYGFNVEWDETWPHQLGRSLGKSVYNYGMGGYGIFHYPYLANEGVKHNPIYIILGLYPNNDIKPAACRSVSPDYYQKFLDSGVIDVECSGELKPAKGKSWLARNSALISAWRHVKVKYLRPRIDKAWHSEEYFNFGGMFIKKVAVLKQYRADLSRKGVKANFEASKIILSSIRDELRDKGIKFGVLVIPSKGVVIEQWAINNDIEIPEKFSVEPEKNLIENYISFLNERNIPVIDSTSYVVAAFAKSAEKKEEFYPFRDSHPLVKGYESYSKAAAELISNIDKKRNMKCSNACSE